MADTASRKQVEPISLITEESVKKVLESDKGSDAILKSWKVVDFTKKGDNYACVVTSVEVKYSMKNEDELHVSYVVKLNSLLSLAGMADFTPTLFSKEGRFYQELVPALNNILISTGQEPLRVPKCFHVTLESGREQIYFEDLRNKGYKMSDRRTGMDKAHASLVLSELARLHSASYLLMDKFPKESATKRYNFLGDEITDFSTEDGKIMKNFFEQSINTCNTMLEKTGGYAVTVNWLNQLKLRIDTVFPDQMKSQRFNSINHGDCWSNNILFRYGNDGHPLEVRLVDLQVCREASIACDLNYFMFTSLTGEVRIPNIDHFMSIYHSSYKEVLEAAGEAMFFEESELLKEFRNKNIIGLIYGLCRIPIVLLESQEVPDFHDTDIDKLRKEFVQKTLNSFNNNPLFKPRFLSIFDELTETGLIS